MNHDDSYQSWKRQRAQAEVPADFADRVMASVRAPGQETVRPFGWRDRLLVVFTSRAGRVGVCTVAGLIFVVRLWHVVGLFFPEFGKAE